MRWPPSMKGPPSPFPQNPRASSQAMAMKLKPSYSSAMSTSAGRRSVRSHSLAAHGDPVGGRGRAERKRPLQEAAGPEAAVAPPAHGDARPPLLALGRALGDRAEAQDVGGVPGGDGRAGRDHRAELAGALEAA